MVRILPIIPIAPGAAKVLNCHLPLIGDVTELAALHRAGSMDPYGRPYITLNATVSFPFLGILAFRIQGPVFFLAQGSDSGFGVLFHQHS